MRPPTIELIDATRYAGNVGDKIRLVIYDEFEVKKVLVSIKGSDGSVIEMGEAKLKDVDWLYTATASNSTLSDTKIEVLAYDVPEHETQKHIIL